MEITKITLAVTFISFGSLAYASDLTVTNKFEANTPASAAEVNQNFDDVKQAVDDNNLRVLANEDGISSNAVDISNNSDAISSMRQNVSVYDGNARVGALLSYAFSNSEIYIMSDSGYVEENIPDSFKWSTTFLTSDCTGQAYVFGDDILLGNGLVLQTTNTGMYEKMYIQPGSVAAEVTPGSFLYDDICTVNSTPNNQNMHEAHPNDPSVTGFPNRYTEPLRIGF